MYIHYPGNSLGLRWTIYRGLSRITEDFESATLTCFLYSKDNKFPVEATVMSAADGGSYLYIELSPDLQLPDGIYGVSSIWKKNEDRSIARSMREGLFSVVNNQAEATDQGGAANIPVLKFHSSAGTFGYDGLSAYEMALLKGLTTKSETEGCIARYGKTPVAFLAQEGIFDFGGAGYHMVHVTDDDIAIMKEKGIAAVTNPASNCKLASGIAPLSKFLAAGIPVGIGTDGPASNNALDMFREMFLATALAKILENDAAALPAGSVLNMAITDGARIMGIPDADSLAEGKLADMILIDMQQPNMQPVSHIANNVVYSGSKLNVVMTVIGGNILYNRIPGSADAGRFDERGFSRQLPAIADIYAKAQSIRDRIIAE